MKASSARRGTVLFLQVPQLDNDVRGPTENLPYAARLLRHAARRAGEHRHYVFRLLPPWVEQSDNRTIVRHVIAVRPAVLACTLYLWNVERTLRILRAAKRHCPGLKVVVGGPEVARDHPFLFHGAVADVAVVGEGEAVFPGILRGFRGGPPPDFATVAWRYGAAYRWGRHPAPAVRMPGSLAGPSEGRPDAHGMAYLETSRGCPLQCAYCRYPHLRPDMSFLAPDDVARRVSALRRRRTREIRFIDPTLNAHPDFPQLLRALAHANADRRLRFFAEIRAESVTDEHAELFRRAHFVEVEVGMQSRDPAVLSAIRRPTDLAALEAGVRRLAGRGIRVTLDVMYGLPRQPPADVLRSIRWALALPGVRVQCLQTLLLPGTDLRRERRRWRLRAASRPPYGVTRSDRMTAEDLARLERGILNDPRLRGDCPTCRFVGRALPDLFPERIRLDVVGPHPRCMLPGTAHRRALLFRGRDLFAARGGILAWVRRAMRDEPDVLWQFVLCPEAEEPLDLLDALVAEIRRAPRHVLDRYAVTAGAGLLASRRVLVWLRARGRYRRGWIAAAERCLRDAFY
jgi:radical SAM superfamily enzyme YgiQ (UPF0313 family)